MRTDRGFTLIEVVVAIALFTITMVYGLSFFVYGSRSAIRAEVRREALLKCNEIVERHRGELYTAAAVSPLPYTPAAVYVGPGNQASVTQYVDAYTHTRVPGISCRIIETTATWKGSSNGLVHLMAIQAPQFAAYN